MILGTGNPEKGFAKVLAKHFKIDFCSRSNGFDLLTQEGRSRFGKKSLDYSVFINNSKLKDFKQVQLLQEVYETWVENDHDGLIVNIGSNSAYDIKGVSRTYEAEKNALRTYSLMLGRHNKSPQDKKRPRIRCSFVAVGWLDLEHVKDRGQGQQKMNPDQFCQVINWIIESPESFNINEISVDAL